MYYLIVNKQSLTTHYVYESSSGPDHNFMSYYTDDIYDHINIPDELLNYTSVIKAGKVDETIYLYVTYEDKLSVDTETWKQIRLTRNELLQQSDFYLMADYPINEIYRQETVVYRQKLRDIPQNYQSPFEIVWPVYPSFFTFNNNFENR
jgi:hypothetical protein